MRLIESLIQGSFLMRRCIPSPLTHGNHPIGEPDGHSDGHADGQPESKYFYGHRALTLRQQLLLYGTANVLWFHPLCISEIWLLLLSKTSQLENVHESGIRDLSLPLKRFWTQLQRFAEKEWKYAMADINKEPSLLASSETSRLGTARESSIGCFYIEWVVSFNRFCSSDFLAGNITDSFHEISWFASFSWDEDNHSKLMLCQLWFIEVCLSPFTSLESFPGKVGVLGDINFFLRGRLLLHAGHTTLHGCVRLHLV